MPYRIRDVAKQAGVSKSTVSRVLNDSSRVDADTRKLAMKTIRELGIGMPPDLGGAVSQPAKPSGGGLSLR